MDLLAAEQALVTKVGTLVSNIEVIAYPDTPETFHVAGPNGVILCQFVGSTYTELETDEAENAVRGKDVAQVRTLEWRITILYRNLRAHTGSTAGIYTYVEQLRNGLTAYTINDLDEAGLMYPVSDRFVGRDRDRKLWEYEMIFRHTIPEVEAFQ